MTPGNYLEHVVSAYRKLAPERRMRACDDIFSLALKAPRFLLPPGGLTVDNALQHLMTPIRLPSPCTVLEYVDGEGLKVVHIATEVPGSGNEFCIEVCTLHSVLGNPWRFQFLAHKPCINANVAPSTNNGKMSGQLRTVAEDAYVPLDAELEVTFANSAVPVLALIQVLQCSNVKTTRVPPSPALNKKRIASGKLPFVEYRILAIDSGASASATGSGTHSSPRQHIRRGHIRRLADERRIWVHQCLVGDPRKGLIVKDYRVLA